MPDQGKGFACDELTGAFLHAGGTKAVLPLGVDIHLVGGGVVQHEGRAGVLARGFVPELAADLSQEGRHALVKLCTDAHDGFSPGHKALATAFNVQELD